MKNLVLPLSFVVFIGMVLISSEWAVAQQPKQPIAAYENPDAYAAYSAVLSMGGPWDDSKTLVILKELPLKEWPIGSARDALQGDEEFRGDFEGIFKSFEGANRQSLLLENQLAVHKPYQLVDSAELEAAFRGTTQTVHRDGWEGFRQSFPNSNGYLILSAVGFNAEKTIAVVFVDYRCGGLCGTARYYILQKREKEWIRYSPRGLQSEMQGNS
jgi:hypothetical protein